MLALNVRFLTSRVKDWLTHSRQPRILHVFDRACNLINERREVLSVVTPQVGQGPFNLVVESDTLFSAYLDVESRILIQADGLCLGKLAISIEHAASWDARPNWEVLRIHRDEISTHLTEGRSISHEAFGRQFSSFSKSLLLADLPATLNLTSRIAGLGVGLTPSGDDFILGAIYATWILHPYQTANRVAKAVVNAATPLTTSLSAAWLESAARGEAGILWHALFEALVSDHSVRIEQSIKNILAIGETSGADALAGFLSVFQQWKQEQYS